MKRWVKTKLHTSLDWHEQMGWYGKQETVTYKALGSSLVRCGMGEGRAGMGKGR